MLLRLMMSKRKSERGNNMPPFVNSKCVNCGSPNRFDLSELRSEVETEDKKEYVVVCGHCGRQYKFTVEAILISGNISGSNIVVGNENRLAGDSSTDAPPPDDDVKKKKRQNK